MIERRKMIRTIITPETSNISFEIPDDYVGKEIEVIAFASDEGSKDGAAKKASFSFTVLHVDNQDYKFSGDEANKR